MGNKKLNIINKLNNMTTLQKLKVIEKKKCIYDIVYRNAGVAFCFYDKTFSDSTKNSMSNSTSSKVPFEEWKIPFLDNWRNHLTIDKYYSTFVKAVNAEYKRLKNK